MRKIFLHIVLALGLTMPVLALPGAAVAAGNCPSGDSSKGQVLQGVGETGNNCNDSGVTGVVHAVVNILSLVVGIAAVIMIVIAGFKYITSAGDTNKVANAKSTLIYALIGLVIAALAQFLVHYVLTQTAKTI